jgi:bifunctional non-homologous end joining protein LigD
LLARKKALARLFAGRSGRLRYSEHFDAPGQEVYERACRMSLEGIISKQKQAPYTSGRGQTWLKIKCTSRQEFVVGGFTDPEGARSQFGALLLGMHERDGSLVYAGKVGTGFTDATLSALGKQLRKLEQATSPFSSGGPRPPARGAHWVKPTLVGEVTFTEWTRDGLLRHPSWEGLREDKPASKVVRERSRSSAATVRRFEGGSDAAVEVAGVRLTHPDRVLYQQQAITKLALARYYEDVAPFLLPHVTGRPLNLVRCPEGQRGQCFYQKHAGPGVPKEVKRVRLREASGATGTYLYVDDVPGLIALTQIGVLEIHPWGAKVGRLEQPDRLVLDFDPAPGVPWSRVVEAARAARALLDELHLTAFLKTTGGKGLHVVAPLRPQADWATVHGLGEAIGAEMVRRDLALYTVNPLKSARRGRIFIDYLRNVRGATAVAAFSTRARPGAPVSTPVGWDELDGKTRPDDFTVSTVLKRLRSLRKDPWDGFFSVNQAISGRTVRALASLGGSSPAPRRSARGPSRPAHS